LYNFTQKLNPMKKYLSIIFLAIIVSSSCKKTETVGDANIRFVNLSPNSNSLNMNANNALLIGNVVYGSASSYRPISANNPLVNIIDPLSSSSTPMVSANLLIQPSIFYSFFLFDSTSSAKVSLVVDDRTLPATGKCNIRFLNFYKGSVSVDIKRGGATNLFIARTTNDHAVTPTFSQYTSFDAGSFSLGAFVAGTSVSLFQLPNIDFVAGKKYTLILRGLSAATTGPQSMVLVPITDN